MTWLRVAVVAAVFIGVGIVGHTMTAPSDPRPVPGNAMRATFAGGCYWCMQPAFDRLPGVVGATAGHAGESVDRREAVEMIYDPERISYEDLLEQFWPNVDPFDRDGQFCDRGSDYRSGIFVHDDEQRRLAEKSRNEVARKLGRTPVTEILEAENFVAAPEFDQNYYRKYPVRYEFYRLNCGRDSRLYEVWGR